METKKPAKHLNLQQMNCKVDKNVTNFIAKQTAISFDEI